MFNFEQNTEHCVMLQVASCRLNVAFGQGSQLIFIMQFLLEYRSMRFVTG